MSRQTLLLGRFHKVLLYNTVQCVYKCTNYMCVHEWSLDACAYNSISINSVCVCVCYLGNALFR